MIYTTKLKEYKRLQAKGLSVTLLTRAEMNARFS